MSADPQVSVVIPCWNSENVVGDAIESSLAQTYPNVEVVVIDDGSTDGSLDVIRSFGSRVRWETGPNRGACAARNRGLQLARGDMIQFLDADDVLLPEKVLRMVPVALASGRSALVVCDWEKQDLFNPALRSRLCLNYQGEDPVVFCLERQVATPSPLHWRMNLERVAGFDEALPCSQERDLHLRLAAVGLRFVYLREVLYVVRGRPNSISSDGLKVLKQHETVYQKIIDLLCGSGELNDERFGAFARAFARDGRHLVRYHNDLDLARRYFALAESLKPGATLRAFGNFWSRSVARVAGPISAEHLIALVRPVSTAPSGNSR